MVNSVHSHDTKGGIIVGCSCNAPMAPEPVYTPVTKPHTHTAPDGTLVQCFHECRDTLKRPAFWILTTFAFPLEHFIWTKLPGFSAIAEWAGLMPH